MSHPVDPGATIVPGGRPDEDRTDPGPAPVVRGPVPPDRDDTVPGTRPRWLRLIERELKNPQLYVSILPPAAWWVLGFAMGVLAVGGVVLLGSR